MSKSPVFKPIFRLKHILLAALFYDLFLLCRQALHQPPKALRRQQFQLIFWTRPLKASVIQALVQKDKSISRKPQRFDSVGSSSAEKEQAVFVDFIAVLQRDDLRQPINSAAKISVAAGDVVVFDIR